MKALRYLLIVLGMMSVVAMNAQKYGKPYRPQYTQRQTVTYTTPMQVQQMGMHSTSVLSGSGSTLPQAAVTGTYTADEMYSSYSPARLGGPRRVDSNDDGFEDEEDPDLPDVPFPLGDAVLPLMALAIVYGVWCMVYRRKRRVQALNC